MNLLRFISHPRAHQPSVGPTGFFISHGFTNHLAWGPDKSSHVLFIRDYASGPLPFGQIFNRTWPRSGQSQPLINGRVFDDYIFINKIAITDLSDVYFLWWLFWSAPVDNAPWKSKMSSDVLNLDVFAYWSRDVRLQTIRLVAATQRV